MKMTAAAAIGALILAASAVPAMAGGYWDGGIVQSGPADGPPPGHAGRCCPCACARDRPDWSEDDRRGWHDQRDWSASDRDDEDGRGWTDEQNYDSGWRDDGDRYDDEDDYGPAGYADEGYYDVGPGYFVDTGGSGGFAGGNVGFVFDFDGRDGFRDRFRDHDRFRDRFVDRDQFHDHDIMHRDHHMSYPPHMMPPGHQPYPQHMGAPHMGSGGHMGGYSHPAMHGGGGRRR